jgi:hypothetical protein
VLILTVSGFGIFRVICFCHTFALLFDSSVSLGFLAGGV